MAQRIGHLHRIDGRGVRVAAGLQDSLSGGSKALMIVNVSPEAASAAETLCSLNFAARVRGIQLGPAKRKLEPGSQLGHLRQQIAGLQAQAMSLAPLPTPSPITSSSLHPVVHAPSSRRVGCIFRTAEGGCHVEPVMAIMGA